MKKLLAALALAALALRLAFLGRGVGAVDRLFVPDDTYYTLAIARSLAQGLGPSADGVVLTSGFQPLIAFLLVPVFWFSRALETPIYASWILGSVADALSTFLLGALAARIGGRRAGVATALLWGCSSIAIANALNGLETSLALALELGLVSAWLWVRRGPRLQAYAVVGVLAGLAMLARIDALFLVLVFGVFELWQRRLREVAFAAGAAFVVVAPWWIYCLIHFGSFVPESGAAVHELVALHREQYLTLPWALGWAAGNVLLSPFVEAPGLSALASSDPVFGVGLWLVFLLLGVFLTHRLVARRVGWCSPYVAFAAFGLVLFCFYSFYLPALWFFRRYFAPVHAYSALCLGLGFAFALRRAKSSRWARSALGVLASAAFLLVVKTGLFLILVPNSSVDEGLHGAKGYRAAARQVLALVPRDAVVGALQSGALAYFANGCPQVVGLDGVVDSAAARGVRERNLADYAAARGVTHFADWPFNRATFESVSQNARWKPTEFQPVGAAKPQGNDRFEVAQLVWPAETPKPAPQRARRCGAP
ncbi:MAG: hypothetical protein ACOY0T_10760 [Myxococcota bacterium]